MHENDSVDLREARVRAAQEQARYGAVAGLGALRGSAMTPMNECEDRRAVQEPLNARVDSRLRRITNDAEGLMRVQAILAEHPEFEQLIELQNLIGRHGL